MSDIKEQLAHVIVDEIRSQGLTQVEVTELYGLQQSRVSNLMNGNVKNIGIKKLIEMVQAMGYEINMRVEKTEKN